MRAAVSLSLCVLQLVFAVSGSIHSQERILEFKVIAGFIDCTVLYRCQSVSQTMISLFVSMSFITPLDYSVVDVRMVDHQPAVMTYSEQRTALL